MKVDPQSSVPPLRLVQPTESVRPVEPVKPVERASGTEKADGLSFEAVYQKNLPKAAVTEALERLDRIRAELVAAKTDVPIHFENSSPPPVGASSPLTRAYLAHGPSPADANASATDAHAARLDETA